MATPTSLPAPLSNLLAMFPSYTELMSSRINPYFESLENWVKQNILLASVTAVAFAILGIAAQLSAVSLIFTATQGVILTMTAGVCFAACTTTLYFLIRHILASMRPQIEEVRGTPPSIALDDTAGQTRYRAQIIQETLNHLNAGFYNSPDGNRHVLDLNPAAREAMLVLNAGPPGVRPGNEPTRIVVKNQDCLYAAAELHGRRLNPLVLDMASNRHFGGEYLTGGLGQEEDCCRRTGLSLAITTAQGLQRQNFYPLHHNSPSAGIYVPHVPVFRAGYDSGYQYLNRPFEIAFGIFAAYHQSRLSRALGHLQSHSTEEAVTRDKIRTFFDMAYQKGHRSVVFGALGCNADGHSAGQIAEITMDVIRNEFAHCFQEIVIAIKDYDMSQTHNSEGNFRPFARCALNAGGRVLDENNRELTQI